MPGIPSPHLYALLAAIHGHLAWLGLALMLHPVLSLGRPGRPTRPTRWSAWLAAAFVSAPYALGWLIYPTYRSEVKPTLLAEALPYAMAFETKEHLALMTLALAWGGALTLHAGGGEARGRRVARTLFACGALTGLATGVLGVVVAARAHGGW
jgi:hypothetical protein